MNEFLPIGTVVSLAEDSKIKFMIVGYIPTNEQGECRDYSAIRYPMGVYDNRLFFFFNKEDIYKVLHTGYIDNDFTSMVAMLNYMKDNFKNKSEVGDSNG